MVLWEVLDAKYDEETRQASDSGSLTSLFEVVKLAYLEPDKKVLKADSPVLSGYAAYGYVAIAIDQALYVFGEKCSSLLIQLTLDYVIDVMIWIPGGEFLFLVDVVGSLHCIHIESKKLIFSKKFPLKKAENVKALTVCGQSFLASDGTVSIVLITTLGQIIILENIDKDALLEGLRQGDIPFLNSLQSEMRLIINMGIDENCSALCAECMMFYSKLWIWIGTENNITHWNSESLYTSQPAFYAVTNFSTCLKLIPLLDGRYIAAVNENKSLSVISAQTGLTVFENISVTDKILKVLDFYELSHDVNTSQLLILAESNSKDNNSLIILNIPSFQIIYDVAVNKRSCILKLGEEADSIAFLEPEFASEVILNLKLKCIVDGQPAARLEKLLRKHKFNEAEEFCGTFGLDVEEVHRAKSLYLCDLINPWGRTLSSNTTVMDYNGASRHFDELLLTLGRISNNEFVTILCMETLLMDISSTEKLLNYAKDRLAKAAQSEAGDYLSSLMQKISKKLYRLHTFIHIFPSADIQHWFAFSNTDMLKEFIDQLTRGELDVASTIWHRQQFEFLDNIDIDCVSRILRAIPITITSEKLCAWLPKNLLKDLVKLCPSSIEVISSWIDNRIKKLEFLEKKNWPANGYKLATTTINALEKVASDFIEGGNIEIQMAAHAAQRKAQLPSSSLFLLRQTALTLRDMLTLAENFVIKIKFAQYTQGCKKYVVAALIDWLVSGEDVKPLMEGFLQSYMIRHNLDCDATLKSYVIETLCSTDPDWWLFEEAPWEDKLYAVINIIADEQIRAHCIVECVRLAPVPWSEGTVKMCIHGMTLNTSYIKELELQERLGKLKIVLRRYNLHLINFNDDRNAMIILRNITSQEKEEALEDALVVVSAFKHLECVDAYFFRLCYWIYKGLYDSGRDLLSKIDEEACVFTCNKFISYVQQHLYVRSFNAKCEGKIMDLTSGVVAIEDVLKTYCSKNRVDESFWEDVRRINTIQKRFNLFPTLDDLQDSNVCTSLLKNYVIDLYMKIEKAKKINSPSSLTMQSSKIAYHSCIPPLGLTLKENKTMLNDIDDHHNCFAKLWEEMERIQHLSWLLGISRHSLSTLLASLASQKGDLDQVLNITNLMSCDLEVQNFTPVIYCIVQMVVDKSKKLQEDKKITDEETNIKQYKKEFINFISESLSLALKSCCPSEISMLTQLAHWCFISKSILKHCHNEGVYTNMDANNSDDPYNNWKFSPIYCDPDIPIEDKIVAKALSSILEGNLQIYNEYQLTSNLPFTSAVDVNFWHKMGSRLNDLLSLTSHLKERSHDFLSLIILQNVNIDQHVMKVCHINEKVDHKMDKYLNVNQVSMLLLKMLSSDKKDLIFAISLLTQLPIREALAAINDVIRRLGYDFDKLVLVGKLGSDFCNLNNLKDINLQFSVLFTRASWGKQLEELGIAFKNGFSGDKKDLTIVLKKLVAHSECSFFFIYKFCEDFSWDITEALSYYLSMCLRNWSPALKENLDLKQHTIQQVPLALQQKIKSVISRIENKVALRKVLENEYDRASPYNYEMLDIIITHLNCSELESEKIDSVKRGREILQFLKVYVRQKTPGEEEKEVWYENHPECRDLPAISKYRLPFHELYSNENLLRKKILELELDVNCVDKWIKIAKSLLTTTDQLYFYAVQTTIKDTFKKELLQTKDWQICSRNSALLLQIQAVITKIQHYDLSTAIANWVVNNLPAGADQVDAAKKCSLLAQCWKLNSNDRKVAASCKNFEIRYLQLAVEHALHKYGLAQPEYLALMKNPVDLVHSLYKHPCLSTFVSLCAEDLPDINSCVKEICNVADLNQISVQLELLDQWLPMIDSKHMDRLDETISNFQLVIEPSSPHEETSNLEANSSLSRVIYLLRCYPEKQAISYLLSQAFTNEENVSTTIKLKALRCLLAIADEETIQKHSVLSLNEITSRLQTMTYVSRLENVGHATSISLFKTIDKNALVEGLWCSQRHNPDALLLLIDLCCDFNISAVSLWGTAIGQLHKFADCRQIDICILEKVLIQIKNLPHLWLLPQLSKAWELIIYYPFKKANLPLTKLSIDKCVHCVNLLLQHCPVEIPVSHLAAHCDSLDLPLLGLAVTSIYPNNEIDFQKIIDKTPKEKLKSQYYDLRGTLALPKNVEDLLISL